jgi:hypothetical protein
MNFNCCPQPGLSVDDRYHLIAPQTQRSIRAPDNPIEFERRRVDGSDFNGFDSVLEKINSSEYCCYGLPLNKNAPYKLGGAYLCGGFLTMGSFKLATFFPGCLCVGAGLYLGYQGKNFIVHSHENRERRVLNASERAFLSLMEDNTLQHIQPLFQEKGVTKLIIEYAGGLAELCPPHERRLLIHNFKQALWQVIRE